MSCQSSPRPAAAAADLARLTDDFTYGALALSPVAATQAGYHRHNGVVLDEEVDDYSPAGIEAQRRFYAELERRAAALDTAGLDKEQRADLAIIKNAVGLAVYELETIQSYRHNPTLYVELAGNALYTPYVLAYDTVEHRFGHIIKRLEKLPALFEQAKANLTDAPEVWTRVSRE